MNLKEIRDSYYSHTGSASTVSRQASFAGIALIWVFKTQTNNSLILPIELLWPVLFLVLALTFDLLQYIVSSAIWGTFNRIKEKELGSDYEGDIGAPVFLNWPTLFFFWFKLLFVIIGYVYITIYVMKSLIFVI